MSKSIYLKAVLLIFLSLFIPFTTFSGSPHQSGGQLLSFKQSGSHYILAGVNPKTPTYLAGGITNSISTQTGVVAGVNVSRNQQSQTENVLNIINSILNSYCNLNPLCIRL